MLLLVSTTYGGVFVVNVPTSGTDTWNSASVSSSTASSASSARSTSSISSTTGSSERIDSSSGRGGEEPLGEEHALLRADPVDRRLQVGGVRDDLADLLAQDLGVEQLLAVVPLVEGLGLVLALVALQPQQPAAGGRGQRLGQLGLADAGRPLDEQRLLQPGGRGRRWWRAGCRRCSRAAQRVDDVVDCEAVSTTASAAAPFLELECTGRGGADRRPTPPQVGVVAQVSRSSRSPFMQWSTTGRTVSKVHSLALPGVQASPSTWLVMRSTSARHR